MPQEMDRQANASRDRSLCVRHPKVSLEGFDSLAVATCRASTIVFEDARAYRERKARGPKGYTYGLNGTPTTRTLEAQLTELERGYGTVLTPSGMSAISLVMLAMLRPGDRVAIADSVYPPVRAFCRSYLAEIGVGHDVFAPDLSNLADCLQPTTALVWTESPGSTTMEVQDLGRLVGLAHDRGIPVGCDNTWATPLLLKPLDLGVDFSMQALTKYVGGHSDLLMGAVTTRSAALFERLAATRTSFGLGVSPDDCSLALRGLETLAVRLAHVGGVALRLAEAAKAHPCIARVLHPAFASCDGHDLWRRDFSGASGTFSVELTPDSERFVDAALTRADIFAIGASWGGTRSLIVPMTVERACSAGGDRVYLRLSVGLEDPDELLSEFDAILCSLDRAAEGREEAP